MNANKKVALFVLRGRPGLGHVIPGLALAKAAYDQGLEVHIASYSNGYEFLSDRGPIDIEYKLHQLDVRKEYLDWPGLCPYDHGVRNILPLIESINADLCFFGGEYLMGPLTKGTSCKTVGLFNPEILINTPKNKGPSTYLVSLLGESDYLLPLDKLPEKKALISNSNISSKIVSHGFYTLPSCGAQTEDNIVVIANGGGVEFPSNTASYSSEEIDSAHWISETYDYTHKAIESALNCFDKRSHVKVFSCLGEELNNSLQKIAGIKRLVVNSISLEYYRYLSEAKLVVSRAGVGFLSDVKNIAGGKVVWSLSGHDEQFLIASEFSESTDNAYFCSSIEDLDLCIKSASKLGSKETGLKPNLGFENAENSIRTILECM